MGNSALSFGGAMDKNPIFETIRLEKRLVDPAEPLEGTVVEYAKEVDGKLGTFRRFNSGGGDPDIVEITRGV